MKRQTNVKYFSIPTIGVNGNFLTSVADCGLKLAQTPVQLAQHSLINNRGIQQLKNDYKLGNITLKDKMLTFKQKNLNFKQQEADEQSDSSITHRKQSLKNER